jgi:lysophospholipase L1-like esterase
MSTHRDGWIAFGEGTYFTDRQLAISYSPADPWDGPIPSRGAGSLKRTRRLLEDGQPVKIALFGDSISTGASASGRGGRPPYVPGWGELLLRGLRAASTSPITFVNPSKGGGSAAWGLKVAPSSLAPEKPDLCILGFGMNDGRATPVATYIENLRQIMAMVLAENPGTEFILVASMMPNPDWRSLAPMDGYLAALKELETETVAVADVWSVSEHLLKTKRYCDLSSNHVNHPSDFMVRLYAQIALALLIET